MIFRPSFVIVRGYTVRHTLTDSHVKSVVLMPGM
jgi:hypothetical protein